MRRLANHIHDAFDSIRADEELKGSTRQFLLEQRGGGGVYSHRPGISKMLVTVCILLLFVVGAGGYSWMQAPVSYVSIDVNPSVELALNRLDRVVGITAFNADGAALVEGLSLKGKKYTDAVNLIVDGTVMRAYLSDDAELVFTVAAPGMRSSKLQAGIAQCHSSGEHNCYSVSADIGLVSVAHEYGFSLGKYHAYLQLSAYDSTITVEDSTEGKITRAMQMRSIMLLIQWIPNMMFWMVKIQIIIQMTTGQEIPVPHPIMAGTGIMEAVMSESARRAGQAGRLCDSSYRLCVHFATI